MQPRAEAVADFMAAADLMGALEEGFAAAPAGLAAVAHLAEAERFAAVAVSAGALAHLPEAERFVGMDFVEAQADSGAAPAPSQEAIASGEVIGAARTVMPSLVV